MSLYLRAKAACISSESSEGSRERSGCLLFAVFHGCLGPFSARNRGCPLGDFGRLRGEGSVGGVAEGERGLPDSSGLGCTACWGGNHTAGGK